MYKTFEQTSVFYLFLMSTFIINKSIGYCMNVVSYKNKNKSKLVCYQEFAYYVLYKQHGNSFVRQRKRRKFY